MNYKFPQDFKKILKSLEYSAKNYFHFVLSLRILLIFDKKTVPGIKMNPTNRITNTIVQLSPINTPFNGNYNMI